MSNRNYKEYHDEIMKEFEMDKESADYKIPDEWDQRFRKIIEDTIKRERRKKVLGFVMVVVVVNATMVVILKYLLLTSCKKR